MPTEDLLANEFSRNIGLFSESEQRLLLRSKVAVAGAGGVGGLHALTLARMGVGCFHLADFDTFERANVSRQFGAGQSTLGENKAEVIARLINDINPHASVRVFLEGVTPENVDAFLEGVDIFVDGIEFFEIDIRRVVFAKARTKGIHALTAAPLGFGATIQVFAPKSMSFDNYFGFTNDMDPLEKVAAFAAGLAPHPYHIRYLDLTKVDFQKRRGPAVSPACTLASSLVATEAAKILTGKGRTWPVPHYIQIDLLLRKFKQGYLLLGSKNPLQLLKRALILKKVRSTYKE